MQWSPFVLVAMGLDTLPLAGRVLLLALLLSCALYGFLRLLPDDPEATLTVLYCKGALLSLLLVPGLIYVLGIRVPVPVEELTHLNTPWPAYVTIAVLTIWLVGFVYQLRRLMLDVQATRQAAMSTAPAPEAIEARSQHWQQRLNLQANITIHAGGAEQPWHTGALLQQQTQHVVLPAAAVNWPTGLQDVMLLGQIAQLQQGAWRWLMLGRLVQAMYWPLPWVGKLVTHFSVQLEVPGYRLAASAYRDPEGWQRDARNMTKRASTLQSVAAPKPGGLMRLPNSGKGWLPPRREPRSVRIGDTVVDDLKFEEKWADTRTHRREKVRDPYEQAYWLIALASILIGVATTLTQVPRAPEFEPQFLKVRWQDQMLPRMRDYAGGVDAAEQDEEAGIEEDVTQ